MAYSLRVILLLMGCLLVGCANLTPEYDPPKVTVVGVSSLPSSGVGPRFQIKLGVANPNKQALDIAGISYSIELQGRELISGVTNEVPLIEGYTEELVTLEAGVNTFQFLRFLTGLDKHRADSFEYRFSAKIDFKGLIPTQRVEETGVLNL